MAAILHRIQKMSTGLHMTQILDLDPDKTSKQNSYESLKWLMRIVNSFDRTKGKSIINYNVDATHHGIYKHGLTVNNTWHGRRAQHLSSSFGHFWSGPYSGTSVSVCVWAASGWLMKTAKLHSPSLGPARAGCPFVLWTEPLALCHPSYTTATLDTSTLDHPSPHLVVL